MFLCFSDTKGRGKTIVFSITGFRVLNTKNPEAQKECSSAHPRDSVLIGWCIEEAQNLLYDSVSNHVNTVLTDASN